MLYARDSQLIDRGPDGAPEAVSYGFWEGSEVDEITCSGKKVALKTAGHPTLLYVLRRCLQGTCCMAKGNAVGSKCSC